MSRRLSAWVRKPVIKQTEQCSDCGEFLRRCDMCASEHCRYCASVPAPYDWHVCSFECADQARVVDVLHALDRE